MDGRDSRKFGSIPEELQARIEAGTDEQLMLWSERVLIAESLAAIFEP
jgi:hypothetical protein